MYSFSAKRISFGRWIALPVVSLGVALEAARM